MARLQSKVFADAFQAFVHGQGGAPSTLTDRREGRPLEFDARNGAVVRGGARHGIDTPANARAAQLMADAHLEPERDLLDALAEVLDPL